MSPNQEQKNKKKRCPPHTPALCSFLLRFGTWFTNISFSQVFQTFCKFFGFDDQSNGVRFSFHTVSTSLQSLSRKIFCQRWLPVEKQLDHLITTYIGFIGGSVEKGKEKKD